MELTRTCYPPKQLLALLSLLIIYWSLSQIGHKNKSECFLLIPVQKWKQQIYVDYLSKKKISAQIPN